MTIMVSTLSLALLWLQDPSAADPSAAAPSASGGSALLEMIHNSGPVAFAVLILLLLCSIFSWSIMLSKWSSFGKAETQSKRFLRAFRKSGRLGEIATVSDQFKPSPLVSVFNEIHDEYQRQSGGRGLPRNPVALDRAAQTASSEALTVMERRMTWLATIAAIAPFIGLLGTVMGIIDAFHGLGASGTATLRAVAPGISEALITTAAGLVVAIPAVVGYNQLTARLREFGSRMDDFGRELLNAIENAAMVSPPAAQDDRRQPEEQRRREF
ncbi:biopolymer transport protein TolQ [Granulicella arctica]|uniref:Biopolymer transport protein TolQ n=2 Tax=Granulicella arctica TaxID=940613 RepID=A0A7Y9PI83_9BACT|nr:MotA/TolQ/ExbB proton channel family protein [Granulicella arctica]NYF80393.1 biopolymer transport protein TolQ [Granulicella arctica]